MPITIQSPQLLHQIVRNENYVERVRCWLDLNLPTQTLNQIEEYNMLIKNTDAHIRILRQQLRNESLSE
jgi:hypothetical protein